MCMRDAVTIKFFPLWYLKLTLCFTSLYCRKNGSYLWHADSLSVLCFSVPLCPFSIFSLCVPNPSLLGVVSFVLLYYFLLPSYIIHDRRRIFHQLSPLIFNGWIIFILDTFFFVPSSRLNINFLNEHASTLIALCNPQNTNNLSTCCTLSHPLHPFSVSPTSLSVFLTSSGSPSCYTLLWGSSAAG